MIFGVLGSHFAQDGLLGLLAGFGGVVSSFNKRNKKSLIFLKENRLFGPWLRGSWQGILRNCALASAPCTFLHSIVLKSKSPSSFYLVKHRVPGACLRGAFEASFRNRALASARCIFLQRSKRNHFQAKYNIFVFPCRK